jgi:glycosyltransferase involved in cell wall biosynthesis
MLIDHERKALALATHVIATSAFTAAVLVRDFAVPANRISVALPGTDAAARATRSNGAPILLAVGAIIPRKGYHVLIEALAELADFDWHLRLVGSPARALGTAAALMHSIEARGLGGRVKCLGDLSADELARAYATSNIFVSSSFYEGYGMALAEAMARGLPIVTTTGGAAADTVPDAAGLKVPPGDVTGLRDALRRLIKDKELRLRLADASWHMGQQLPNWRDAAKVIAKAAQNLVLVLP